jgi:hypothetical protein
MDASMTEISYSIYISAPAARVWEILADFPAYPSWNPFIRSISGAQSAGSRLKVSIQPQGGKPMTLSPTVLNFSPTKEFRWKGQLLVPGVFDGEHYFQLSDASPGSTRLTHGEIFSGFLIPLVFRGALRGGTERGFQAMNQALKQRAEASSFSKPEAP